MKINKNIKRIATFSVVGALGIAAIFAVNNNTLEDSTAITGSWANFVSTSWMNESDARYKNYKETPGTTESSPYLIQTAEEFSGIRAFEGGDALAGKYMLLTADIDLSAHYWDPIELYGYGDPEEDINNGKYNDHLDQASAAQMVHLNGNSMKISGMRVENGYDRVLVSSDFTGNDWDEIAYAGSTGLFSYVYKASISDIRLDKPVINLTETSGISAWDDGPYYYGEIDVFESVGSVVGVSQNSHIAGVHVNELSLNYTAKFGETFGSECPEGNEFSTNEAGYCYSAYMPYQIMVGGAVGYSFGETLISETSVKGGAVNVKPMVDEKDSGEYSYAMDEGGIAVAGLVGVNSESTILSTCSSANVVFSDDDYDVYVRSDEVSGEAVPFLGVDDQPIEGRDLPYYRMFFGGLVGFTNTPQQLDSFYCVYNSCSHSELAIDAEISDITSVGGIAGFVLNDVIMNNYYDGNIKTSNDNIVGEIAGVANQEGYGSGWLSPNYHQGRYDAVGYAVAPLDEDFIIITTIEKLAADLNAGRQLVIDDIVDNSNLTQAQATLMTTEWSIQDGTFPLACTNARSAGLVFPDNRVDVPNTGAK